MSQSLPTRTSPRASRYDYSSAGVYFITICTKGREEYFGKIVDKKLILNEIGKICEEEIHLTNTRDGVDIVERIIMPNHVHMLIHIDNNAPPNVGTTRALSEHNKNMDENDLEKYLDENDLEKYLDENDLEKYLDENNLEKYTDENNLKKYTDENDLEKYTNENDLEKYTDENDLKKYTDENDLEKYTDENDLEKYTDENDLKKYSDENDLEKYSDEARLVPTTTKHTIKIHIQNQSLGSLVGSFKSSVSRICHKKGLSFARQSRYHDHIVRNETEYNAIKHYIRTNPEKRKNDKFWIEI